MPIYDFKCADCDTRFQKMRKISDDSLPACVDCGSENTSKLISPSGFVLKGSGWYMTDYGQKSASGGKSSDQGSSSSASGPSSSGDA